MADALVETAKLTKRYGELVAVDDLDLSVHEGEIYGFLGPNGSGKTTTILMLLGLTEPSSGSARVVGHDPLREPIDVKRVVSYLPENVGFYNDLTGRQNLRYTGHLNSIPRDEAERRIDDLLDVVRITDAADRAVGGYSRGMRQRLGIADALLKQPRVVFLDDPTIGLDPEGIQELLDLVQTMSRDQSITIFLSSHILQQVQRICHRIGIMFRGRLVAEGTVEELSRRQDGRGGIRLEVEVDGDGMGVAHALKEVPGVVGASAVGSHITLQCIADVRADVAQKVIEQDARLVRLQQVDRSLEDIYLQYFHEAQEAEAADASPVNAASGTEAI